MTATAVQQTTLSKEELRNEVFSLIQSDFPLEHEPYRILSEQIDASPEEILSVVDDARNEGLIRRIGPVFDSYKLGYVSCLCAVAVPEHRIAKVAGFINRYFNVTHNYLRADSFNIWFTVIAYDRKEQERIISDIERYAGSKILRLPALRLFKIKVDFNLTGKKRWGKQRASTIPRNVVPSVLSPEDKALIRIIQGDGYRGLFPYQRLAERIRCTLGIFFSEQDLLAKMRTWKDAGIIRRFGITLRHHKVGVTSNVMVVWDVPDCQARTAGELMSLSEAVSHCYERPRCPEWPSNLYTMVHGKTPGNCHAMISDIRASLEEAGIDVADPKLLYTERELKKTSMEYFREDIV